MRQRRKLDQVLDEKRHAAEHSGGRSGAGQGAPRLKALAGNRVEGRVQRLDPGNGSLREIERGHVTCAHQRRLGGGI